LEKIVRELTASFSRCRFKIEDDSRHWRDNFAAWACVRLDRLRQGYRFIELKDAKGKPSEGKLFVKIEKVIR
jgi:hypothetical protein